jgi:ribonuclease HI
LRLFLQLADMDEVITVNFDGGSRGNPGVAGTGIVLRAADGTALITVGRYIGRATNNVAEYRALIDALRHAKKLGAKNLLVRGDSELIIKQMRGEYRVKNEALKDLYGEASKLAEEFESVRYEHNLRERNSLADRLANLAMDRRTDVTDADELSPREAKEPAAGNVVCPNCGCEFHPEGNE